MNELGASQVSGRTALDRYRDFRQVFFETDTGKRVLNDILAWGHIWKSSIVRDKNLVADPYMTFKNEGERNLALLILTILHREPKLQPDKQQTRDEGG